MHGKLPEQHRVPSLCLEQCCSGSVPRWSSRRRSIRRLHPSVEGKVKTARLVGPHHVRLQDNTHLKSFLCALVAVNLQHPETSGPISPAGGG